MCVRHIHLFCLTLSCAADPSLHRGIQRPEKDDEFCCRPPSASPLSIRLSALALASRQAGRAGWREHDRWIGKHRGVYCLTEEVERHR